MNAIATLAMIKGNDVEGLPEAFIKFLIMAET